MTSFTGFSPLAYLVEAFQQGGTGVTRRGGRKFPWWMHELQHEKLIADELAALEVERDKYVEALKRREGKAQRDAEPVEVELPKRAPRPVVEPEQSSKASEAALSFTDALARATSNPLPTLRLNPKPALMPKHYPEIIDAIDAIKAVKAFEAAQRRMAA